MTGGGDEPADGPTDDRDEEIVARDDEDTLRPVRAPVPVGETIGALVGRRGWEERLRGAAIHGRWSEIVGEELAQRCEPVRLAGGILVVRVESSTWATQVDYLSARILDRAREVVGADLVREIRITVGRLGEG